MNRNVLATIAATVGVAAVVILGFRELGSPGSQRLRQADRRTVQSLARVAQQIKEEWQLDDKSLPKDLEKIAGADRKNPISGKPFGYHVKSGSEYELCATFAAEGRDAAQIGNAADAWAHPEGDYCFQLDASRTVPMAPYY